MPSSPKDAPCALTGPAAPPWLVVMGVAGCGKSTMGQRLADGLGLPFIEGDRFHPPGNVAKMAQGVPLTDADRAGWLHSLGQALADQPGGAVLACSALKRAYRERLRAAAPGLRFVHLALTRAQADVRVAARAGEHMFPPSLVASQFATLEDPAGEPGVLVLDADWPTERLCAATLAWLEESHRASAPGSA